MVPNVIATVPSVCRIAAETAVELADAWLMRATGEFAGAWQCSERQDNVLVEDKRGESLREPSCKKR